MKRVFNTNIKRKTVDLCGAWKFLRDEENVGLEKGYNFGLPTGRIAIVPSVWNNDLGMLEYDGVAFYEKKITTEEGTVLFNFGSVMTEATVYLDGEEIGYHYGGFCEFEIIKENVKAGEHTLVVRVNAAFNEHSIPQERVDWFNYGGIARDVLFSQLYGICILNSHIDYTVSDGFKAVCAGATLELYNSENKEISSPLTVKVGENEIYSGQVTLSPYEKRIFKIAPVEIANAQLWSCENPRLYTVECKTETDDLIDRVGFRRIEAKDGKILLNGEKIQFRGVNRHEEHPEWGFAFPPALMQKDIDLIKDLGMNTVRGSHYPQSRAFIDMLDEQGILFWSEIPIWGGGFSEEALSDPVIVQRGLDMHKEMVKYYYNHPSIIIWGMHNEIYTPYPCTHEISRQYHQFLRENGGNRLITHASLVPLEDSSMEFDDIICLNKYRGWYTGEKESWEEVINEFDACRKEHGWENKPVIISEFGAGALYGYHSHFDRIRWSEEYQEDLISYCIKLFDKTDYIQGYYIWQFTNIRTSLTMKLNRIRTFNNKGILDEYRNPKSAYFAVKELNKTLFRK